MMPAAKHGDPQVGIDIHLCIVPPSPSPVPLPAPHTSIVFDPFDYIPVLGATVTVCGMKRATAGTNATAIHIPPGFPFAPPKLPDKDDELFMGSSTVVADGDPLSYIAVPVLSCQVAGMMGPPRPKKPGPPSLMVLPTTVNLAIPTTVVVGGAPTISLMGMAMKGVFSALGKFAKSGLFKRMRKKLFGHMNPGFLKCTILRAEPVNILTGAVAVDQEDFALPGRIPFEWIRSYSSGSRRTGLCGYGWETVGDTRLEMDGTTGHVTMVHPSKGPMMFERLPVAPGEVGAELELIDGALLSDHGHEFRVRTKEDRIYHFDKTLAQRNGSGVMEYRLVRISDLSGNTIDFEWSRGTLRSILDAGGRQLVFQTDRGRITAISMISPGQPTPHVFMRYEYDQVGNLVSAIDALGHPYTFGYEGHVMTRHTDRNGLSFYYDYRTAANGEQRVVHAWGDGGLYDYQFEYIDVLNERRITDSLGHVTIVKLNEGGLPISEIDPLGGMTSYEYDEAGRTTSVTDPGGKRTAYQYDERGNLLKLTRPDGASISTTFNEQSKAIEITDPNGATWKQEWNERGLLTAQTTPLGNVSRYDYSSSGQLSAFLNPREARTALRFDDAGNLIQLTDALGHNSQFSYDPFGNVTSKTDPLERVTRYEYDRKGRLTEATLPSGASIACGYDSQDNLTRYVDENGAETRLEYFGQGEIARRIQPDGYQVEYLYDTEEKLIGVKNQRGETYRLHRDALGRIVEEVDYWGQSRRYAYDQSGYLKTSTDPLDRTIHFVTDPLGRIVKKLLQDGFIEEFAYDANGNLIEATNPHIKLTRLFDPEGRLLKEAQGEDFTIENQYDEVGNRIQRITSLGNTVTYLYDLLDRVSSVGLNEADPIKFVHDAAGQITHEALSSQLSRRLSYSLEGLLTEQTVTVGGKLLLSTEYDYNKTGNLTRRTDSQYGSDFYEYDPLGRIIKHIDPQGRLTQYLNDAAGDRLVTQVIEGNYRTGSLAGFATKDWRRQGEYRGAHYCFDRAGNLIERRDGKKDIDFTWDSGARLTKSCVGGHTTKYKYDPLGRRIFKEANGLKTQFLWDANTLIADAVEQGNEGKVEKQLRREWVYYPKSFEPLLLVQQTRKEKYGDRDSVSKECYFYHNEPNGCPKLLLDAYGEVLWAARYGVGGKLEQLDIKKIENPLRLQGQYYDDETELHYNRHRYYEPTLGAYVSIDPIRLSGGLNLYSFGPNVHRWIDPHGLKCDDIHFGQRRIAPHFRNMDAGIPDYLRGRALRDVADDLKAGRLHPDQLEVKYFIHPETGQRIAESNRTLAALSMAGKKPTRVREVPVSSELLSRLDEPPLRRHGEVFSQPGRAIPVTPGQNDNTIIDVARLPD